MSIRKISLLVIGSVFIISFGLYQGIRSKQFSSFLITKIQAVIKKEQGLSIQWREIDVSFFPPTLSLKGVRADVKKSDLTVSAEVSRVDYYIDPLEILERRLSFGQLKVSDGVVIVESQSEKPLTQLEPELIEDFFNYQKKLPVLIDTLRVDHMTLIMNKTNVSFRAAKLYKKWYRFFLSAEMFSIDHDKQRYLDELWMSAEVTKKNIKLNKIKAKKETSDITFSGEIKDYFKLKGSRLFLDGLAELSLSDFSREYRGDLTSRFSVVSDDIVTYKSKINLTNLSRGSYHLDKVVADVEGKGDSIDVRTLEIFHENQAARIKLPFKLDHVLKGKIPDLALNLMLKDFEIEPILNLIGINFQLVNGQLSGEAKLVIKDQKVTIDSVNDVGVKNFKIKDSGEIVSIRSGILRDFSLSSANHFLINSSIILPTSNLGLKLDSSKDSFHLKIDSENIRLAEIENILNLDLKGSGRLNFEMLTSKSSSTIKLIGSLTETEFMKHKLGAIDTSLNIDLLSGDIFFEKMDASFAKRKITATGVVNFKTRDIALGLNTSEIYSHELFDILSPYIKSFKEKLEPVKFKAKLDVDIFGKIDPSGLKIRSHNVLKNISVYDEIFDSGRLNFLFKDNKIFFNDIYFSKKTGIIVGEINHNIKTNDTFIDVDIDNLSLSNLNLIQTLALPIEGSLSGFIKGHYGKTKNLDAGISLGETSINHEPMPGSMVDLKLRNDRLFGEIDVFQRQIYSKFNLDFPNIRNIEFDGRINSSELKPVLVLMFGESIQRRNVSSEVDSLFSIKMDDHLNVKDLNLKIEKLRLKSDDVNFDLVNKSTEIIVQDFMIKKWNLNSQDKDFKLSSVGVGHMKSGFSLKSSLNIDAKLVEILDKRVLAASGRLTLNHGMTYSPKSFTQTFDLKSDSLGLTLEGIPVGIASSVIDLSYSNDRLRVNQLTANLDSGNFDVKGDVVNLFSDPDFNLKFKLEKAEVPLFSKSTVNISGEGSLVGTTEPYSLTGDFTLNKASFLNEITDYLPKGNSSIKFLPRNKNKEIKNKFDLNLNVKADLPIRVTNSLMDLGLLGQVRVLGNPSSLRGEGRVFTTPNSSRVFFKNAEYTILSGDVIFNPKKSISNPDFDVKAQATISNYRIYPKAYGDLERFTFDLSSEPSLPRNSIFSLIAFGYTDEIQSTLTQSQQQNLTQVGVGSFVFDRFKISDILNKQFGLQINLGTVFEQSQRDSLLAGRSQDGNSNISSRTISATKIELKKRLDEALTLSVSSTMGGGIGQRQSMNLNYGLSQKVQVEGIYELKSNAEGEEDIIDKSIGADLKLRWTFK